MNLALHFLIFALSLNLCHGKFFVNPYPRFETHSGRAEDNYGEEDVLYVTPLLEAGKNVKEIQKMAAINLDDLKAFPGYSGFFTVNKTFNSNMFFWYFPAQTNSDTAPTLLWLQGKFFLIFFVFHFHDISITFN
jgi:vitellogenic carboxypeptidase-like protein